MRMTIEGVLGCVVTEVAPEHPVGHAARHHQPPKWSRVHGQGILQPQRSRANFSELRTSDVRKYAPS